MTLCFVCKTDQSDENLALCKKLEHAVDTENQFQVVTKKSKENPLQKLVEFAKKQITKFVISQADNSRVFVVVKVKNHFETIELDKKNSNATNWLMVTASVELHQMYSEELCGNAISFLKAFALMDSETEREEIHLRIAYVNHEIYYDLGRSDWKFVKITSTKQTLVEYSEKIPTFIRTSKIAPQVIPNFKFDENPLNEFVKLCKIPNPELFQVQLISMFLAGMPMPIMAIHGHAGASKSTTSSMVKRIVDPAGIKNEDNLKSFPHGEDNFVTSLSSSYFSGFENISYIDLDTSNMLCRAITGGSFEKRAQYTNGDVFSISLMRKILINGIDFTINHSDLADRTNIYEVQRILETERKADNFIEAKFHKILPDLLGQIFLILQRVLETVGNIEKQITNNPARMASFGIYGEAIYQALGHKHGQFLEIIRENEKSNLQNLYDSNPIIPCMEFVLSEENETELQANDLYKKIKDFVIQHDYNLRNIPQGSNGLFNWITKSKTLLDEHSIEVTKYTNSQSKDVSGFTPNSTIYHIKRVSSPSTNELDL